MFLPENIDLASSEKYDLNIRLSPNGFSFLISCPDDPDIFFFKETIFSGRISYSENIKKLIFDYNFFTLPFNSTSVTIVSTDYIAVPDQFFDEKIAKTYFNFNVKDNKGHILHTGLHDLGCHLIFDIDEDVYSFLSRNLWNPVFSNHTAELLNYCSSIDNHLSEKRCFINFHEKLFDVCCFQGRKILSVNSYKIEGPFDALYFITGIWEKLPLDQENDLLYLCGSSDAQRETVDTLKKHIRRIKKLTFPVKTHISDIEKPKIPTDLMIKLCE